MAAPSEDEGDGLASDNYYAWLGVHKEASQEDITNAFRRLSRIYHPDKHTDEEKKEKAALMFNKIKKAHEVLTDPHKRAIYDTMGVKGLETEGWEVVSRVKTPREIMEEYERLAAEAEERRLQQRTNPKGTISVGINATDFFDRYEALDAEEYSSVFPTVEISSMSISQSVEAPLTERDTAILHGTLSAQNGTGGGQIGCTFRRVLSHLSWAEMDITAGSGATISLRGFRTLWKRGFGTMGGTLQFTPNGIAPGFQTVVATQLDRHTGGRMTWTVGRNSSLGTTVNYDYEQHHLNFTIQLGVPTLFASVNYSHRFIEKDAKMRAHLRVSTLGVMAEGGVEQKISKFSVLGASLAVGMPAGVILKIKLNRGNQTYLFPIHLSDEVLPSAVFYGTVIPLAAYFAMQVFVIRPYLKQQEMKQLQRKKEQNAEMLLKQKLEAEAAMELMKETVEKIRSAETKIGGLVITKAFYGKISSAHDQTRTHEENHCIDVTDPLQALVKDSRLTITDGTELSSLPGFYDPCFGEKKELLVCYLFKGREHRTQVEDASKIVLPKRDHCIDSGLPTENPP